MGAMWHATWDWRRGVLAAEDSMMLGGHGLHYGGEGKGVGPLWEMARTTPTTPEMVRCCV